MRDIFASKVNKIFDLVILPGGRRFECERKRLFHRCATLHRPAFQQWDVFQVVARKKVVSEIRKISQNVNVNHYWNLSILRKPRIE